MSSASATAPAAPRPRPKNTGGRHRDLRRFLLQRLGTGLVLCVGITLVAFVLTHLVPGDPAAANLGQRAIGDPAAVQAFRHQYGLDRPLPVQYLLYLKNLLHGNLGISEQSHRPVRTDLAEYIPATIELALFVIAASMLVGIGLGVVAAVFRNRWPDQLIRVVSLGGVSMPVFWIALVAFYLFFFKLGWLPGGGRLDPTQNAPTHLTRIHK